MNTVRVFWQDKFSDDFYWIADKSIAETQSLTAIHQLESPHILKADLACLADVAQGKNVELVLSSLDIHSSQVTLPNKAQRHLRKAVPYLLEEQISENIDDVFIAIGERLENGDTPVRVISLDYLKQILEQFEQAEIKLTSIRVDLDLLETPETGYLLTLGCELLISEQGGKRWNCNRNDFGWLVQKRLAENSAGQDEEDADLVVAVPMQVVTESEEDFTLFQNQLPVGIFAPQAILVESVQKYLSKTTQQPFNLLQAEYEPKIENSPLKKILKKTASLVAILFIAHIVYQVSQIISLSKQQELLTEERTALRKQAFPSRKKVNDKTLNTFMKSVKGGAGESSFLSMLESTSSKIKNMTLIYPTNISYDASRSELRLDVIAKDLPVLNQYRDDLKQVGFEVEMSSATQRGDSYSSRIIVRK